jgi:hypothetical protein
MHYYTIQQKEMFAAGGRLLSSPFHVANLFTVLHVAVCEEPLKALQEKEAFLSHCGINNILVLLLKLLVIHDNTMVLFWVSAPCCGQYLTTIWYKNL